MWHDHWIGTCLVTFLPLYSVCRGSIFQFSDDLTKQGDDGGKEEPGGAEGVEC